MKRPAKSRPKHTELGKSIICGMKEAQARAHRELELRKRVIFVSDDVDVHAIREKSGLSQSQFAERYGFNPRTLQDWEQGRSRPDSAVRAYLTVIDRNPSAVENALRDRMVQSSSRM
jgi:putative transcriptional regulator